MEEKILKDQLLNVLKETNLNQLGNRYEGKVRDSYINGDRRILITTDRLSCFDKILTTIPFKGEVLQKLALYWFDKVDQIVPHHIIDVPDPNVMVVKNCKIIPIEVVVRGYLTGSAWRDYMAGKAISGIRLPSGMLASEKLPEPLITPSTKAEHGLHDQPISEQEIVSSGIVSQKLWHQVRETALALFAKGQEVAIQNDLYLVDTKYEFGEYQGKLILADEIHTLDSSRFWVASSYKDNFSAGRSPVMLDKEPVRQWLISQGYMGEGPIPKFSEQYRIELANHYINSYQKITGVSFLGHPGDVLKRIEKNLAGAIPK